MNSKLYKYKNDTMQSSVLNIKKISYAQFYQMKIGDYVNGITKIE